MAGGSGEDDLNLVPYMDILVNLLVFLLAAVAMAQELREVPVLTPAIGGGGKGSSEQQEKQKPFLTAAITSKGIAVLSSAPEQIPGGEYLKDGTGRYPLDSFKASLRQEYKDKYADLAENLVLVADANIPYKVVMEVMDAARTDGEGDLFPQVTLAKAQ